MTDPQQHPDQGQPNPNQGPAYPNQGPPPPPQPEAPHSGAPHPGPSYPGPSYSGPSYSGPQQAGPQQAGTPYPGSPDSQAPSPGAPYSGAPYPGALYSGESYAGEPYAGAPYPGPTREQRSENPFGAGIATMWASTLEVWRGRPEEAVRVSKEVTIRTGTSWAFWLPTFVVVAAVQFVLTLLLGLTSDSGGGAFVGAVFAAIFNFGMMCLLSLAVMLAHRTVGSPANFSQSATSLALGQAFMLWGTIPTSLVMNFLSGLSLGIIWVVGIVAIYGFVVSMASFTLVYLSAREDGPHRSSILLPLFGYIGGIIGVLVLILLSIVWGLISSYIGYFMNPWG